MNDIGLFIARPVFLFHFNVALFLQGACSQHHTDNLNMSYNKNDTQGNLKEELARELEERSKPEIALELSVVLFVGATGLVGNFLTFVVICKVPSLRTMSNYYVASLSLTEVLLCASILALLPAVVLNGRWVFSDETCQFQGFVTTMLATASIYAMMLVAINRYFIMVKSNLHRRYFTKRKVLISIVFSWILGGNFPISYVCQGRRFEFHPGKGICVYDVSKLQLTDALLTGLFNLQIPYIIISLCYYKIYKKVKQHNVMLHQSAETTSLQISAKDIRITKILFAIVLAFTLCWSPFYVIDLLGVLYGPYFAPRPAYLLYSIMAGSSAAINPVLYGGFNREVRREITKLLVNILCYLAKRRKITPEV